MNTEPRMNAPIARLQIRTSAARKRRDSAAGRVEAVEPSRDAEVSDAEEAGEGEERQRYYPFAPRIIDSSGG